MHRYEAGCNIVSGTAMFNSDCWDGASAQCEPGAAAIPALVSSTVATVASVASATLALKTQLTVLPRV
eukprot:3720453-Amphidinium_carterae.1